MMSNIRKEIQQKQKVLELEMFSKKLITILIIIIMYSIFPSSPSLRGTVGGMYDCTRLGFSIPLCQDRSVQQVAVLTHLLICY